MFDLKKMTLEEKVGQFLMIGFRGKSLHQKTKDFIKNFYIGGVILFEDNLRDQHQTTSLCRELQEVSRSFPAKTPLFIAVDQEGGRVSRLKDFIPPFPPARLLGQIGSIDLVKSYFRRTARELRLVGINMNLAPVLDIDTNPKNPVIGDRAFGKEPGIVVKMGVAAIEALHHEGVITTAKHFPGHGDTSLDSHLTLPKLEHNLARLKNIELKPFRAAIHHLVDTIMTAHVVYKGVDPEYPATLSKRIIHDLLRKELKFKGVVISDDLVMKGITESYNIEEAALLAKNAGTDILLISQHSKNQLRVYERLISSIEKKEISLRMLDKSLKRILKLKERYLS